MENNTQTQSGLQKFHFVLWAGVSGILVYLYLIVYQPFGTYTFQHPYKQLVLLPYGAIGFIAFAFSSWVVERKKAQPFTFSTIILEALCIVLLTAIMSYCYNSFWLSKIPLSLENFISMLGYALAVVAPIIVFYFLGRFSFQFIPKKTFTNINDSSETNTSDNIVIKKIQNHILPLVQDGTTFLYAEAADNYCYLYHEENGELKKSIIRSTLKKLEQELDQETFIRTHRSFLVNITHIHRHIGNSAGYKIYLGQNNIELPVSRNYVPQVLQKLDGK